MSHTCRRHQSTLRQGAVTVTLDGAGGGAGDYPAAMTGAEHGGKVASVVPSVRLAA